MSRRAIQLFEVFTGRIQNAGCPRSRGPRRQVFVAGVEIRIFGPGNRRTPPPDAAAVVSDRAFRRNRLSNKPVPARTPRIEKACLHWWIFTFRSPLSLTASALPCFAGYISQGGCAPQSGLRQQILCQRALDPRRSSLVSDPGCEGSRRSPH
jgi:hypothetical protein